MKTLVATAVMELALACPAFAAAAAPADDAAAEMQKCAVCKVWAEKPDLMKAMTFETHKIDNGMLCVMNVPKEQKKEFDAVHAEMMKNIAKVMADEKAGKPVELCHFCQSMSKLTQAGAKQQNVGTSTGMILLVTSDNPQVVAQIHAQADKNVEEQKKMQQQAGAGG